MNNIDVKGFIRQCDEAFSQKLREAVDQLFDNGNIKVICLSGPTCSGKTTAAGMILGRLSDMGLRGHLVSVDDFFYDREYLIRLSEYKGLSVPDYDSVDTIDLAALGSFAREIFTSDTVHCPRFDFQSGNRTGYDTLNIGKDDIFVFEGIQCIYPEVLKVLEDYPCGSIFISPESPIKTENNIYYPNEIRLMRRIVRDSNFRGTSPEKTFAMWQSVRKNEEENIFPHTDRCDVRIDTTMPYEIGVLKPYLENILKNVPPEDAFRRNAEEMLHKISGESAISSELIPADSLYREFV